MVQVHQTAEHHHRQWWKQLPRDVEVLKVPWGPLDRKEQSEEGSSLWANVLELWDYNGFKFESSSNNSDTKDEKVKRMIDLLIADFKYRKED